jgi:hypothetical protein
MDPRYQVKHYLTRLVKADGRAFDVFDTGEDGWLLFAPIVGHTNGIGGWQGSLHIPVRRKDLKREISRMIPRHNQRVRYSERAEASEPRT